MNTTDLAKLLGYHRDTVNEWVAAGCPRLDDGSFVVAEVVKWLIARAVEKAKAKQREKPKTELNRKLSVEADLKELQLERERAESLPAEEYFASLRKIAGSYSAVAKGRLARFEREAVKVAADKNPPAAARRLMDRISEALLEGAREVADELEAEARAELEHDDEDAAA